MFDDIEARLERVSMRYAEEFARRLSQLVDKDAPMQYVMSAHEVDLLKKHVAGMRQSVVDGLSATFGPLMLEDNIHEIDIRIDRFARAIVRNAQATAEEMLPLGTAFGIGYNALDTTIATESTPVSYWIRNLHGGQLTIVVVLSIGVGLVLLTTGALVWFESIRPIAAWGMIAAGIAAGLWTLWAVWIWLGSRRARATLAGGTEAVAAERRPDPMDTSMDECLAWFAADLRKRFREVQNQRLDIIMPLIDRGELDRDAALSSEMDEARRQCAALFQVLRDELTGVAARWREGTLAVEAAVTSRASAIMDAVIFIKVSTLAVLSRRLPLEPLDTDVQP